MLILGSLRVELICLAWLLLVSAVSVFFRIRSMFLVPVFLRSGFLQCRVGAPVLFLRTVCGFLLRLDFSQGGLVHIICWVLTALTFGGLILAWRPWLFVRVALVVEVWHLASSRVAAFGDGVRCPFVGYRCLLLFLGPCGPPCCNAAQACRYSVLGQVG